jgi:hypothetical protein
MMKQIRIIEIMHIQASWHADIVIFKIPPVVYNTFDNHPVIQGVLPVIKWNFEVGLPQFHDPDKDQNA